MNIWQETKNEKTGESSLKTHELRTVWTSCKTKDHYFELTGNRECTCSKCGFVAYFVLGIQILKDGKIVSMR